MNVETSKLASSGSTYVDIHNYINMFFYIFIIVAISISHISPNYIFLVLFAAWVGW